MNSRPCSHLRVEFPYTRRRRGIPEEALENLRKGAHRIGAVSNRLRATGMREDENHLDPAHRVASALAMTEAAGMEARRKLGR